MEIAPARPVVQVVVRLVPEQALEPQERLALPLERRTVEPRAALLVLAQRVVTVVLLPLLRRAQALPAVLLQAMARVLRLARV